MNTNKEIPIFYSVDDNYIPCLAVALESLIAHTSRDNNYRIIILNTGISNENVAKIMKYESTNVKISFEDISSKMQKLEKELELRIRDYYTITIYYRLFIASLFPQIDKAIYLDADMLVLDDVAKIYNVDMGNNLLIAVRDEVVASDEILRKYSLLQIGVDYDYYFNSGMLVMNLREMRKSKIEEKFIYMLTKYNLQTICPDQDYLNVLCRDRVIYLNESWDKMSQFGTAMDEDEISIIHYNMFRKPWHYKDANYSSLFWKWAKKTEFFEELVNKLESYSLLDKKKDEELTKKMLKNAQKICKNEIRFAEAAIETEVVFATDSFEEDGEWAEVFDLI